MGWSGSKWSGIGRLRAVLATVLVSVTSAVGASAVPGDGDTVVVRWNEVVLDSTRNSALGPPAVARALAVVHTCMYDAWAAYDLLAAGTGHGGALRRPPTEHTAENKAKAMSYAAHRAVVDLFPGRRRQSDALMTSLGYDPAVDPVGTTSPEGVGATACAAVLAARHGDASNQTGVLNPGSYSDWTGYRPLNRPMVVAQPLDPATVVDPDKWQPLVHPDRSGVVRTQTFLAGHWANVKPFSVLSGSVHRPLVGPAKHGTDAYAAQAAETVRLTAALTDRHKAIAEYWADGPDSETPPGHWAGLFAQFVSRRDHHTDDQDVKMFFMVANAVLDASIAAWDAKRAFDSVRPITAVRYLYRGRQIPGWGGPAQGMITADGALWRPYQPSWFPTPPFPEFVSGHSAFSAAAAEVLRSFTGSDAFGGSATVRAGSSAVEPGVAPTTDVPLAWSTFSAAAEEAGMSRRYGGIHFARADLDGRALGRLVGTQVWLKATRCFAGVC
ncbi:vanadium-dependent haloperoxidase [Saccharothrix stipae]